MNEEKSKEASVSSTDALLEMVAERAMEKEAVEVAKSGDSEAPMKHSRRFKRRMNRMWRKRFGFEHILHPEVDNVYERVRSRIEVKYRDRKATKAAKKAKNA